MHGKHFSYTTLGQIYYFRAWKVWAHAQFFSVENIKHVLYTVTINQT